MNGDYVFSFKGNVKVVEIGSALWMFEIDGVQKYIVEDSGMESLALSGHITKVALTNWGKCTGTIIWAQLEKGSTPTAYAPYENIRPIKGRDSVTVNLASGVKNWRLLTLTGTETWSFEGTSVIGKYGFVLRTKDIQTPTTPNLKGQIVCNKYATLSANDTYTVHTGISVEAESHKYFRIYDEAYADKGVDAWKAYLAAQYAAGTPVQVAYKLAAAPIAPEDGAIYFAEQPAQSGSGDPSPTNIRPILLDGAVKDGGTNVLTLPETVYDGEVDAVSGEGKQACKLLTLDGTEAWDKYGNVSEKAGASCFYTYISDKDIGYGTSVCNKFANTKNSNPFYSVNMKKFTYTDHPDTKNIYMDYGDDQTVPLSAWKAYLAAQYAAGTPVQVCYKLATPVPFTATGGAALPALAGVNTVLTDADSVEVTGRADPIKRIEDLEAAVASIN